VGERQPPQGESGRRLVSWKAIAGYLGVSVRTAQKWERERGLPVHRTPGKRATVFASARELDAWAAAGVGEPPAWGGRWKWAGAAVLVFLGAVLLHALYREHGADPHSWSFAANTLVIFDAHGVPLWRKSLPPQPANRLHPDAGSHTQVQIADLDSDGRSEVVVGYVTDQPPESRVDCYSADGELRWTFQPGKQVRTPHKEFSSSFDVRAVAVIPAHPPSVAVASVHAVAFPSEVALLSPDGAVLSEYWHSGYLTDLAVGDVDGDARPELLAGGVNQAERAAELVVLDPEEMNGCSREPQECQLLDLGPPVERLRLIFPKTCLARRLGNGRNRVSRITLGPETVAVQVEETPHRYNLVYRLRRPGLKLSGVEVGSAIPRVHNELYKLGLVDHRWSDRDLKSLHHLGVIAPRAVLAEPSS